MLQLDFECGGLDCYGHHFGLAIVTSENEPEEYCVLFFDGHQCRVFANSDVTDFIEQLANTLSERDPVKNILFNWCVKIDQYFAQCEERISRKLLVGNQKLKEEET